MRLNWEFTVKAVIILTDTIFYNSHMKIVYEVVLMIPIYYIADGWWITVLSLHPFCALLSATVTPPMFSLDYNIRVCDSWRLLAFTVSLPEQNATDSNLLNINVTSTLQLPRRTQILTEVGLWLIGINSLNTSETTEWTVMFQLLVDSRCNNITTCRTTSLFFFYPNLLQTFFISERAVRCVLMLMDLPLAWSAPDCVCPQKKENSWCEVDRVTYCSGSYARRSESPVGRPLSRGRRSFARLGHSCIKHVVFPIVYNIHSSCTTSPNCILIQRTPKREWFY